MAKKAKKRTGPSELDPRGGKKYQPRRAADKLVTERRTEVSSDALPDVNAISHDEYGKGGVNDSNWRNIR